MEATIKKPNYELAKSCHLPLWIMSHLTNLPKPTRLSTKSGNLVYPELTRWLAAIINRRGVSTYKTAKIVGMKTDHSVRTAVKAYDAGKFDHLTDIEEYNTSNDIDITDTKYLQDFLDDAEAELEDLQKRYDTLNREYAVREKVAYTTGYVDGQLGLPMQKEYT